MEGRTPEEKKKIKIINANLESNLNGVTENHALSLEINHFFFPEKSQQLLKENLKTEQEMPVAWFDMVIEKLRAINAKNAGICLQLRRLHSETID